MCLMVSLQVTGIRGRPGPMVSISCLSLPAGFTKKNISNVHPPQLTLDGMRGQPHPS